MTRYRLLMLGVALTLLSVACRSPEPSPQIPTATEAHATFAPSKFEAQLAAAGSAITLFHVRLDQRNYRGIYAMTDVTFRAISTEAQLTATLTSLRERLGRSVVVDELSYEVLDRSPDVQVTFVTETIFESGTLIEKFVWRVTQARWSPRSSVPLSAPQRIRSRVAAADPARHALSREPFRHATRGGDGRGARALRDNVSFHEQ